MSKPLAFSYLRLSSKKQRDGDGYRRQYESTALYCEQKGLILDHELEDIGVSAYSGANRERGALAQFLKRVRAGEIPRGSHLVVESLDRLSREQVLTAFRTFSDILEAGITIHTTSDGRVYDAASVGENPFELIISIAVMSRAHDESKMKIIRQRGTWVKNRRQAREDGKKVTARCPTWLTLTPDRTDFAKNGHTQTIKRIFRDSENGIGCDAIARRFNKEGIAPLRHGREWHGGGVRAILTSIAVRGWYQPSRMEASIEDGVRVTKRVADGEPIKGYYPEVIDDDQWNRTWASMQSRKMGKPSNAAGRKGLAVTNLFSGIGHCPKCNSRMNVRDRGAKRRQRAFLICSGARNGKCSNKNQYVLEPLEQGVLQFISEIDLREDDPIELRKLESTIAEKRVRRAALDRRVTNLFNMFAEDASPRAQKMARDAERELTELDAEIVQDEEALMRLRSVMPAADRQEEVRCLIETIASAEPSERYAIRSRLQQTMRELIRIMGFMTDGHVLIVLKGGSIGYVFNRAGTLVRRVEGLDQENVTVTFESPNLRVA